MASESCNIRKASLLPSLVPLVPSFALSIWMEHQTAQKGKRTEKEERRGEKGQEKRGQAAGRRGREGGGGAIDLDLQNPSAAGVRQLLQKSPTKVGSLLAQATSQMSHNPIAIYHNLGSKIQIFEHSLNTLSPTGMRSTRNCTSRHPRASCPTVNLGPWRLPCRGVRSRC